MEKAIKNMVVQTLKNIIKRVEDDDCSEESLGRVVAHISYETNGYLHEKDYVNADEAMRILRINNRNKFFDLMKRYGISNKKINNSPIGFPKKEIEELSKKIN